MAKVAWGSFGVIVSILATIKDVSGVCQFPASWSNQKWMTRRVDFHNDTLALVTYAETYAYKSYSYSPDAQQFRYDCDQSRLSGDTYFYIRSHTDGSDTILACVAEKLVGGVILHRETGDPVALTSLDECMRIVQDVVLYAVYTIVDVTQTPYALVTRTTCPFEKIPYQISFTFGEAEQCNNNLGSILTVTGNSISILACNYQSFPRIPLTGLLYCVSSFEATALGEPNNDNGQVFVFQWRTSTQKTAFTYCARFKSIGSRNYAMSIDITNDEGLKAPSEVACIRDATFDLSVRNQTGRDFVRYNLNYQQSLASTIRPPIGSTTRPIPGSSTSPGTGVSTTLEPLDIRHVQFTFDLEFVNTPNQREDFIASVRNGVSIASGIDENRISIGSFEFQSGRDKNLVVTFDVVEPTEAELSSLEDTLDSGQFVFRNPDDDSNIDIKTNTFYTWRDTDPCPTASCENDGVCMLLQGVRKCDCLEGFEGPACSLLVEREEGITTTTIAIIVVCCVVGVGIIIGVVVFVILRQNKSKEPPYGSEAGYGGPAAGGDGSIDDLDREMYSTINKKPKAYHDRSFTNLDKRENGELTGIHM